MKDMKVRNMSRLFFYAAGLAAIGYAAKRVPWARVGKYLSKAEIPEALTDRIDSWRGTVRHAAQTVLEEPFIGKAAKSVRQLHS